MREKVNYFFNWGKGGYNSVFATDKRNVPKEVAKKFSQGTINQLGGICNIKRDADHKLTFAEDRATAHLFY